MKSIRSAVLTVLVGITLFGCKKKDDSIKFTININDSAWAIQEAGVKAVYFPKFQHLFINASDGRKWFYLGTNINAASPLTNYAFEPNGNNAAAIELENIPGYFISDNNVADAGEAIVH